MKKNIFTKNNVLAVLCFALFGCGPNDGPSLIGSGNGTGGAKTLYAFQTAVHDGNIGNYAAAQNLCQTAYGTYTPASGVSCSHFYPLIGYTSMRGIQDLPGLAHFSTSDEVRFLDGTPATHNGSGKMTYSVFVSFMAAYTAHYGFNGFSPWSGFNTTSGAPGDVSATHGNCNDWTSNSAGDTGAHGLWSSNWDDNADTCNLTNEIPCICL